MEIKLKPYESLTGIKIFDGIDEKTGNPYCKPGNIKQIYDTSNENVYDGEIELCKAGFHFSLDIFAASDYKYIFRCNLGKKYPNALIMNPIYCVVARDKILSEEYERFGGFRCKYITNNLTIGNPLFCNEILHYITNCPVSEYAYSLLNASKSEVYTHEIQHSNRCLIQSGAKDVIIDTQNEYHNYTIFSNSYNPLTVKNKTKYTHYVNRYVTCEQYITPVPRYSTVEFKPFDKIGKVIKNKITLY